MLDFSLYKFYGVEGIFSNCQAFLLIQIIQMGDKLLLLLNFYPQNWIQAFWPSVKWMLSCKNHIYFGTHSSETENAQFRKKMACFVVEKWHQTYCTGAAKLLETNTYIWHTVVVVAIITYVLDSYTLCVLTFLSAIPTMCLPPELWVPSRTVRSVNWEFHSWSVRHADNAHSWSVRYQLSLHIHFTFKNWRDSFSNHRAVCRAGPLSILIFKSWQVCDWLAKWLIMLEFMELNQPRVSWHSNIGRVDCSTVHHWLAVKMRG